MASLKLPCFDIIINYDEENRNASDLVSDIYGIVADEEGEEMCYEFGIAVEGIEATILSHFRAGIDVSRDEYVRGIEESVNYCKWRFAC